MKKKRMVFVLIFVMLVSVCTSMLNAIHIIDEISNENAKQRTHIISARVRDNILSEMLKPITVAKTMSNDESLIQLMEKASTSNTKKNKQEITRYLESIRSGFDYQMVFAVNDTTKEYYTYKGVSKIVDIENDEHDIWYKLFCESGKNYDLDVDTDEANNWNLSVFVNIKIKDHNGKFLGVCGVGVEMPHLQTLLEQFENEYNIKINLVDYDGLVQVDTDESKIENSYLSTDNLSTDASENFIIEKKKNQTFVTCYIRELDWFLVIQDYGVHRVDLFSIIWSSIGIMIIGVAVMLITFAIIFHQGKKLQGELSKKVEIEQRQMDILIAMSRIYQTSHVINLKEDTVEELRTVNYVMKIVNQSTNATKQMVEVMKYTVSDTYLDAALKFTDLKTLADRMKHSEIIMDDFLGKFNGWFRAQFIVNSLDSDGNIETVIFTTQIIDFEKKYEDRLVEISITDELTGVYNRRAYDKKIKELEQNIPENLEIVAIDLNGLKLVNDTLGHEAGDELIQGAANCIQSVIDTFGQVYRTGGDEFIAVVELEQNQNHVLLAELKEKMQKWHGTYELTLTASCGIASHKEFPELTISKLASVADKRMYEDKCKYYRQSGNNRRKKYDEIKLNQE